MTLIKFKSESPSRVYGRAGNFNEFFNDLFDNVITSDFRKPSVPGVNISETDNAFHLEMAAPGFSKDEFKINIENELLTISAEKETGKTDKDRKFSRREFSYASFKRSFTLPEIVDAEKIQASYENGLLLIELSKKAEARPQAPRQVTIA